ncbi:hypothetical protein [Colwellia hornerae]|uniref:Uncharacterized protein n=1 Tax=Colwellia hornerae TaxID=89402 RepID=A0A5C6QUG5_9GAMM|nr:hypothetical protein [Colwellia hornerae]TWX56858.1 hypothetical protein ESZ28_03645 [Colwellia hornerae]TWX62417.1 hypothetical protein ESZ26_03245 [Colwellia hornerae]TWX72251.1 hypothetical protein ESZ27_00120 [Colwellia hornerae]
MLKKILVSAIVTTLIVGCQSTGPSNQTNKVTVKNKASNASIAKSAYDFADDDITVPAYFDTQGLERCTFDIQKESDGCPLKKPIVRIYFDNNDVAGQGKGVEHLKEVNNLKLVQMLENQLAGLSRFRIITRDDQVIGQEQETYLAEQGASAYAKRAASQRILAPDFVVKIDTTKTVDTFYAQSSGVMDYTLEMTAAVIDPFTKEKMSHPNIGKIRVKSADVVKSKDELNVVIVSGRYYSGFNFADPQVVQAMMSDMASRGFDIFLTRMLSEMPATAQVLGIKGDRLSLDRGQNAGVLVDETMIVFQYEAGFVEPIGVATVTPSKQSASGKIVKWKNSKLADSIKKQAGSGIFRPGNGVKIFAVSVGTPANFLENRT